jgi:predicted DNA-binding transcriptional regulator YafY
MMKPTTMKKTVRLQWLKERLVHGVRIYPPDAARELGVDLRSIQRDLVDLQALELPLRVTEVEGRTVYYLERADARVVLDFRIEDLIVTHLALGMLRRYTGTRLDEYTTQLMGRIEDRLSDKDDARLLALSRKLMVRQPFARDFDARGEDPLQSEEDFSDIVEGLLHQRQLALEYVNMHGQRRRHVVHPYTLLVYKSGLYLVARADADAPDAAPRVFAVERVASCELLRAPSTTPSDWDPETFVPFWGGLLPGEEQEVHLRFSPQLADYALRLQIPPGATRVRRRDGALDLITPAVCNEEFFTWILGFGTAVRVLEPAHLREALVARAREMLELYE